MAPSVSYKQNEMIAYKTAVQLEQILKKQNLPAAPDLLSRLEDIEQRLQTRKFRIAVVGEFNRGKSSLINVLLGKKILPEDVVATTATINRVTYGEKPRAYLIWKADMQRSEEIPVEELAAYVTKLTQDSAEKAAEIYEAVVEYPTMLCYHDVDLLDTPGMNDADDMNAVTVNRLNDIDLAIVAINAMYPFSETESHFTIRLLENSNICRIIFVVTHIDMIREREREKLLAFLRARIPENVRQELEKAYPPEDLIYQKYHSIFDKPKIYAVSSVDAMEALEQNDAELFSRSGFLQLNRELPDIILSSRSVHMIGNIARTLEKTIDDMNRCRAEQRERWVRLEGLPEETTNEVRAFAEAFSGDMGPEMIQAAENALLREKERIVGALLQSLGQVVEESAEAVRRAVHPTMYSEEVRLNKLIGDAVLDQFRDGRPENWRRGIEEIAQEARTKAGAVFGGTAMGPEEEEGLSCLPEQVASELVGEACEQRSLFQWKGNPAEAAIHTETSVSVIPELARAVDISLEDSRIRINGCLQKIRELIRIRAEEQIRQFSDGFRRQIAEGRRKFDAGEPDPVEVKDLVFQTRTIQQSLSQLK